MCPFPLVETTELGPVTGPVGVDLIAEQKRNPEAFRLQGLVETTELESVTSRV